MFGWWALTMHVLCCAALVPKALVMATPRPLLMAAPKGTTNASRAKLWTTDNGGGRDLMSARQRRIASHTGLARAALSACAATGHCAAAPADPTTISRPSQ